MRQYDNRWKASTRLQPAACLFCLHPMAVPVHRENGFRVVRCNTCGFHYVSPRPAPQALARFYQDYYPQGQTIDDSWERLMADIFRHERNRLIDRSSTGRVLDIGCGLGYFLAGLKGTGWEGTGLDLCADAARRAREQNGVDARAGSLEEQGFEPRSFDAVTMFYVLEHVSDPADLLRAVRRLLRPEGLLIVRVPDMAPIIRLRHFLGFPASFFCPPMHLSDFGPAHLRRLLIRTGFVPLKTETAGWTCPPHPFHRLVSMAAGGVSRLIEQLTDGRRMLPGVSKTTLAVAP